MRGTYIKQANERRKRLGWLYKLDVLTTNGVCVWCMFVSCNVYTHLNSSINLSCESVCLWVTTQTRMGSLHFGIRGEIYGFLESGCLTLSIIHVLLQAPLRDHLNTTARLFGLSVAVHWSVSLPLSNTHINTHWCEALWLRDVCVRPSFTGVVNIKVHTALFRLDRGGKSKVDKPLNSQLIDHNKRQTYPIQMHLFACNKKSTHSSEEQIHLEQMRCKMLQ